MSDLNHRTEYDELTIRRAVTADGAALRRLAVLDDGFELGGEVIVAEVQGEIWAAHELGGGRMLSDPFRPAQDARELLALRAARLNQIAAARAARRGWLRHVPSIGQRAA
jgi:hypothetical protein